MIFHRIRDGVYVGLLITLVLTMIQLIEAV